MSNLFFTFVVEWPQNGNFWYGLLESPPGFGITQKGEFKRKTRNSQNPGTELFVLWTEKRKSFEGSYEFQLHQLVILTYGREKTLLLDFRIVSKPNQVSGKNIYTWYYFIKQAIKKYWELALRNNIQNIPWPWAHTWFFFHLLISPSLTSCPSATLAFFLLLKVFSFWGASLSFLGEKVLAQRSLPQERLHWPQLSKGSYFSFS